MNRERVHAAGKLGCQDRINHAMALEPVFSPEGFRYDGDPEMGFAAGAVTGVPRMLMGFVNDIEALRRESLGQLVRDEILDRHGICLRKPSEPVNRKSRRETKNVSVKT